jgi:hypothetical protein
MIPVLAAERGLGPFLACHAELLGRELGAVLIVGLLVDVVGHG